MESKVRYRLVPKKSCTKCWGRGYVWNLTYKDAEGNPTKDNCSCNRLIREINK